MMTPRYKLPLPDISPLIAFAKEREAIRLKRLKGEPPPWTTDPILSKYRFTNIRRKDDRVSEWIRAHVYIPTAPYFLTGVMRLNFLQLTAWCRWVNWPPMIRAVLISGWPSWTRGQPIDWPAVGRLIDSYQGKKWTGAYMIRADNTRPGRSKGAFVCEDVIAASAARFEALDFQHGTREHVWLQLRKFPHFGDFMAGQVVDDWTWDSRLLYSAVDQFTWAPQGPGSMRGFNRLMGRPLKQKVDVDEWNRTLYGWRVKLVTALGADYNDLTLHDVQNLCCEMDKYERVRLGEGRPRATYVSHNY